jgi:plasmid stability protein
MPKMIQIRDVPEQLHGILKARAAREGMNLSDFLKRELEHVAERPTRREWLELTQRAKPIPAKVSAAQVVRRLRDAR